MKKIKDLQNKYPEILNRIFSGCELVKDSENELIYIKGNDNLKVSLFDNKQDVYMVVINDGKTVEKIDFSNIKNNYIEVVENKEEIREKGIIREVITRKYIIKDNKCELVSLVSNRTAMTNKSLMTTKFETSLEDNKTYLNGVDVSHIYNFVYGKNKLERIFSLYNGVLTKDNITDLINISTGELHHESFDYKGLKEVTKTEDKIVGKKEIDYNNILIREFINNELNIKTDPDYKDRTSIIETIVQREVNPYEHEKKYEKEYKISSR